MGISKERIAAIKAAALELVDAVEHDRIEDDNERQRWRHERADALREQTGCSLKTARFRIMWAVMRKRHPGYAGPGGYQAAGVTRDADGTWGGPRPGAGRPKKTEE